MSIDHDYARETAKWYEEKGYPGTEERNLAIAYLDLAAQVFKPAVHDDLQAIVAAHQPDDKPETPQASTHWEGCGKEGGPRHYECLLHDYEAARSDLEKAIANHSSDLSAMVTTSDLRSISWARLKELEGRIGSEIAYRLLGDPLVPINRTDSGGD